MYSTCLISFFSINSCTQQNKSNNIINENETMNNEFIPDPLDLEYEFIKVGKLDDGSSANMYLQKGIKPSKDGDYGWSKCVPLYASNEIKSVYEYQMEFTDKDFQALYSWLQKMIGNKAQIKSLDTPKWYKENMKLKDIYNYCKINNENITMIYYNKKMNRLALVILDSGSEKTKTLPEIAIVLTIFND
jgi:hypothetical protein